MDGTFLYLANGSAGDLLARGKGRNPQPSAKLFTFAHLTSRPMQLTGEQWRRLIHVSMAGFALVIGRLPPWLVVACILAALLFNLFLLQPLTRGKLEKDREKARGYALGLLAYPGGLLLVSLVFFEAQVYLAVGWGAMAFGDSAASWAGKRWGHPLPWNPQKSWAGLAAFVLVGTPLTWLLLQALPPDLRPQLPVAAWLGSLLLAHLVAGWFETLPGQVDDNLSVPLVAAATACFGVAAWQHGNFRLPADFFYGLGAIGLFMLLSHASRKIDAAGVWTGGLIALLIFLGGGFPALGCLLLLFVLGTAASLWRKRQKEALGLAQEGDGQRSARHAFSNAGVAGVCGLLAWVFPAQAALLLIMLVGSLASATGDTWSSELGNLYGRRYLDLRTGKRGQRGQDGVISLEGSLFGALGSLLVAGAYALAASQPVPWLLILLAGLGGNLIDSLLGASLQRVGLMTNDAVNFASTFFAALLAAGGMSWLA